MDARSTSRRERRAHRGIGEAGMRRLEARPLAVHLGHGIGLVELDVADPAGRDGEHPALAALLDAPEDLLLHQHVVGEVVLAGLEHGAGGADESPPHLISRRSKYGRFGDVVGAD